MKDIITLVTEKDSGILKDERPNYLIYYIDDKVKIIDFPLVMKNKNDFINNPSCDIAYDFDDLNKRNQEKYSDIKRTFEKSDDEFYIEGVKEYTFKRKVKSKKNTAFKK